MAVLLNHVKLPFMDLHAVLVQASKHGEQRRALQIIAAQVPWRLDNNNVSIWNCNTYTRNAYCLGELLTLQARVAQAQYARAGKGKFNNALRD